MINGEDLLQVSDDESTPQESKLVIPKPPDNSEPDDVDENNENTDDLPSDASMIIDLLSYEKRGEGINAFLVYKIATRITNMPGYSKSYYEVWRRFSDFLGLREKLLEKYQHLGILVPTAPEKSISALTKTKLNSNSEENHGNEIVDKRARDLKRFLRRISRHPKLVTDCDFRDFITIDGELPKSISTSAFSGSSVKKMFKSFGDVFSKIAFPMDENDRWFEQVHSQVDELDELWTRLMNSIDALVTNRKELALADEQFSKGLSMLASCEENTSLARILSKLAETHESLAMIEKHMNGQDSEILFETVQEHMALTNALKELFFERVKTWQNWQTQVQGLSKKRETKTRHELSGKTDKANQYKDELVEYETKVDQMEKDFQTMSKIIRGEFSRTCKQRRDDIRDALIKYFESLIESETHVLEQWEKLQPEVKI
uniref:PX domain-containing protein n=1 Tax=Panagrolaimus sp. JU765 TaxID=591449 RepID=A0AC34QLC5_9BILA